MHYTRTSCATGGRSHIATTLAARDFLTSINKKQSRNVLHICCYTEHLYCQIMHLRTHCVYMYSCAQPLDSNRHISLCFCDVYTVIVCTQDIQDAVPYTLRAHFCRVAPCVCVDGGFCSFHVAHRLHSVSTARSYENTCTHARRCLPLARIYKTPLALRLRVYMYAYVYVSECAYMCGG